MAFNSDKVLDWMIPVLLAVAVHGLVRMTHDMAAALESLRDLERRVERLEMSR